jgi:predicted 2-oxoglutarate/Fe(II)-dependent dioxygenase YbiX/peroxiredoxin
MSGAPIQAPPPAPTGVPLQPALGPGDRAPNFVLPEQNGNFRMFYERVRGYANLLLVLPAVDDAALAVLADLAARYDDLQAAKVDVFAVANLPPANVAALAAEYGLPFLFFADEAGKIVEAYRQMAGRIGAAGLCLLLDENQRLLTAIAAGGPVGEAALDVYRARQHATPLVLSETAPVLVLPNVLPRATCTALIERWETQGHDEGAVHSMVDGAEVQRVYHAKKKRLDHPIHDPVLTRDLSQLISRRVGPELVKVHRFEGFRFDRFIIGCYDAGRGDYFRPHRDNMAPATADRAYAISINLNAEDFAGGDLTFPEYGPHFYRAPTGGAVVFSCSLIHEAHPVTRGRRFALLTLLRDARAQGTAARG